MGLVVEIVTPEKMLYSGEVEEVVAQGVLGEFGVRPGHTPLLVALEPGRMLLKEGGKSETYAAGGGFAEVTEKKVILLVDSAEASGDLDLQRAEEAAKRRAEQLKSLSFHDAEYGSCLRSMRKHEIRATLARKGHGKE